MNLHTFLQELITRLKINCEIDLCIDPAMSVSVDENVFRYGVEPILDNAIFYNKLRNGGANKIKIKTTRLNKMTLLSFSDSGPGISESRIDQVFDMFYIGNEASEGNGLGLFISKTAMNLLNINITIKSRKGEFTNVLLDLSKVVC